MEGKLDKTKTIKEVLRVAAALHLDWRIDENGRIRDKEHNSCPITAVCKALTGRRYAAKYWEFAAGAIGLSYAEGAKLADACDKTHRYDKHLREEIKKILIHKTM